MLKIKFRKTNSIKTISINNFQIKDKMYFWLVETNICKKNVFSKEFEKSICCSFHKVVFE